MSTLISVNFDDADPAQANILCGELEEFLRRDAPEAQVTRQKTDPLTQDFGATLVLVLGTTAVTVLAQGIADWLATRHDARLHLTRKAADGSTEELTVEGQLGRRAQKSIADFLDGGNQGT